MEIDPAKRRAYLDKAAAFLQLSVRDDEKNPELHFKLGWVYDELGLYGESIRANQRAIELDPRFAPWAYWVMAVSRLKQGDPEAALQVLESIQPGPWWGPIFDDEELTGLRSNPRFSELCQARRREQID